MTSHNSTDPSADLSASATSPQSTHPITSSSASYASESTTSLQSMNTITSTTPLSTARPPQKDYAAAFANLQSRYGTSAGAISTPFTKPQKKNTPSSSSPSTSTSSQSTLQASYTPPMPASGSDASLGSSNDSQGSVKASSRKADSGRKDKTSKLLKKVFSKGMLLPPQL